MKEKRTYMEVINDLQTAKYGKECRKLHKELKQLDRRNGLPLFMRYPNLPDIATGISLALVGIASVVNIIAACLFQP